MTLAEHNLKSKTAMAKTATAYAQAGLSVIPTNKETKCPALPEWKLYQKQIASSSEIHNWFLSSSSCLGIVAGEVSGNLEMIDFDQQGELFDVWANLVDAESPGLVERLLIEKSQNSGRHVVYRCPGERIPGNTKLAMRGIEAANAEKITVDGKSYKPRKVADKFIVEITLIETRGEGGQFLAAPSPGYKLLQGSFAHVPTITRDEREILINAALFLNEWFDPTKIVDQKRRSLNGKRKPGTEFNERGEVKKLLVKHGWTLVGQEEARNGNTYQKYRRPGKKRGWSASLIGGKIFYVFTTNGSPLDSMTAYSPFALYTLLEHEGDYSKAAAELSKAGYGSQGEHIDPMPILRSVPDPLPFPIDVLGDILSPAAQLMAETIQAPLAICGQSLLASATLAVQAHADMEIDGRRFPLSEYFITVGESGERKSAVDHESVAPHRAWQDSLATEYDGQYLSYQNKIAAYEKSRAEFLNKGKTYREREDLLKGLDPPPRPPLRPLTLCQEPTYEGLIKLLIDGQPSIGLFADEGGRMIGGHGMNTENQLKTAAGLCELWDGQTITRVRAGEDANIIKGRRFCMHIMAQPKVIQILLSNPLLQDQGILSRCLISSPETTAGKRLYREINLRESQEIITYRQAMKSILEKGYHLKEKTRNELQPRRLNLSDDSKRLWISFHDHIEKQLAPEGPLSEIRGFSNKAPEHAARLAGVLTLIDSIDAREVPLNKMEASIALVNYYISEASRIHLGTCLDPNLHLADTLKCWLHRKGKKYIDLPSIYQSGPSQIRDCRKAREIVSILKEHGCLQPVNGGKEIDGHWKKEVWRVVR